MWSAPLLAVLVSVACGDDEPSDSQLTCGEGTMQSGNECVPASAGGSESGGGGTTGGSTTGGGRTGGAAGEGDGGTGVAGATGGSGATDGGDGNEGGEPSTGGTAGQSGGGGAGAGMGGVAGSAGTSAGTAGAGGSGGGVTRTAHWLIYRHETGLYTYEMGTFPATEGTLVSATGSFPSSPFSPDGTKLLYNVSSSMFVVDATTTTLGTPINLGAAQGSVEWSADSASVLLGGTTTVIGVHEPAPIRHTITSMPAVRQWAPTGNRLAYIAGMELSVVNVVAGVPGQPTPVMTGVTQFIWSPTGTHLAAWSQTELAIVDLRGATPVVTDVTTPIATAPSVMDPLFSHDGSRLVFSGRQERDSVDLYLVNVTSPAAGVRVDIPGVTNVSNGAYFWATNQPWLMWAPYSAADAGVAVDLSQGTPTSAVFPPGPATYQWVPGQLKLVGRNAARELSLVDAMQPGATPVVLSAPIQGPFSMSVHGNVVAYSSNTELILDDLAGLSTPPTTVSSTGGIVTGTDLAWTWSRDGRYIAFTSLLAAYVPDHYDLRIVRVEGTNASSAVMLSNISEQRVTYAWQP